MRFMTTFLIEKNGVFPRYEKYSSLAASTLSIIHRKSNEDKVGKEDMAPSVEQGAALLVEQVYRILAYRGGEVKTTASKRQNEFVENGMERKSKFSSEEERKEHNRAYQREYRRTHKEQIRAYNNKYTLERPDKIKERQHRYYLKQKARYEEQGTTIYFADKEKRDAYYRNYLETNRDEINRRQRERYRQKTRRTEPDQLATIFKNPRAAAAYRWLIQNRKQQKEQL